MYARSSYFRRYGKEQYYLFACDKQLNVLGDTFHDTVKRAMIFAGKYYDQEEIKWFDLVKRQKWIKRSTQKGE